MTGRKWRPRKRKFFPLKTQNIGAVIYLFLGCHAHGLDIMLGKAPFPDSEELSMMLAYLRMDGGGFEDLGTRVQHSGLVLREQRIVESAETVEKIVQDAGGIERFVEVFRQCQRDNSEKWRALVDWHRWVKVGRPAGGGSGDTWRLKQRYHQHTDTLRRWRETLILQIADEIAYPLT